MRSGLETRRALLPPFGHFSAPTHYKPETRRSLQAHSNLVQFPPVAQPGLLAGAVRLLRRVAQVFIRPWLGVQTEFNHLTVEAVEALHREILTLHARIDQFYDTVVNRENGPDGKIARAGLWFNPPIAVRLEEDKAEVLAVSERILENMYVHTRLPPPPARVLDLGCAESTTAIEMASFGYRVDGVDLRSLRLAHPSFSMIRADIGHLPFADATFDVAVSLSTIEHVGLDWYAPMANGTSDHTVIAEIRRVLRPGGRLILTVPFGRPAMTPVHRVYDQARLDALLRPLRRVETLYGVRSEDAWTVTADAADAEEMDSAARVSAVALTVAEKC
jgi:SAM-dependent methyltransferase